MSAAKLDVVRDPSFGLVILNWNNASDTLECLGKLVECDPRPTRVVVVDNGSEDDSVAAIRSWWSAVNVDGNVDSAWLTLLETGENLGFAGGSNRGISTLLNDPTISHVQLLNNDTIIPSDFFAKLSTAVREAGDAGILGPTIREFPATDKIWYAGGREHFFRGLVLHSLDAPGDEPPGRTDFVTGCAMVISRNVIETIGDLSEQYFPAYFEDSDFCHRAARAGFSVIYAPRPFIYHKVGATVRAAGPSLKLAYVKNRLRVIYVRRNYRGLNKAVALTYLAVTKPARSIVEVAKGQPRYAWQVLRGTISGFLARDIA